MAYQVLFGMVLSAANRLSAKAGSLHHGLSTPGLLSGIARLDMGPLSFLFLGKSSLPFFQVQVDVAVLIIAVFETIRIG